MPQLGGEDQTHDLSLQKVGETAYGFILARDRGRPLMRIRFAPTPQSIGASDTEASYASISPDIDKVVAQDDWRKGMGQDKYSDARRYAESIGCDARSQSGVLLGPVKNDASTLDAAAPSAPTLANADFETWSGGAPSSWEKSLSSGVTLVDVATPVQSGTHAVQISGMDAGLYATFTQRIPRCSTLAGRVFTVSVYSRKNATNFEIRIRFLDGPDVGATQAWTVSSATYTQYSLTYTAPATESPEVRMEIRVGNPASADVGYIDLAAFSFSGANPAAPALGTPVMLEEYSGSLYQVTSTAVWKWSTADSHWDNEVGGPQNGTWMEAWSDGTNDHLLVACGSTRDWWYLDGADTTWKKFYGTAGDADSCDFFVGIGANAWKALKPNKLASTSSPFNGTWTQVTIDKVADDFTGLIDVAGVPYMGKENGLFKYVSPTVTEIATELRTQTATTTGKNLLFWKSSVLFPAGTQALFEYQPADNALGSLSPGESSAGMVAYSGRTYALAGDDQYVYAFVGGATGKIELLAGRYESIEGTTYWVWHPILQLTASDVAHAVISTITSPSRLWFLSTESSVNYIRNIILPDKYSDVTQATSYTFATGGEFITGTMDMGFVDQDKPFASVVVLSENLTANITIAVSYKIDADASWTALGTVTTSPLATLYFPTTSVKYGKKIRLRFVLATNTTATSPRLKAYALHGLVAFTRKHLFEFTIKVADNLSLLNGAVENQTEWLLAGALRDLANQPWVILKLPRETTAGVQEVSTYYVRMSIEDAPLFKEPEKRAMRVFNVQAVEVKLSA